MQAATHCRRVRGARAVGQGVPSLHLSATAAALRTSQLGRSTNSTIPPADGQFCGTRGWRVGGGSRERYLQNTGDDIDRVEVALHELTSSSSVTAIVGVRRLKTLYSV